jgi:hypothetical protein
MNNTYDHIRLRRAAPKMLEVLREIERHDNVQGILHDCLIDEIKEVIADASPIERNQLHEVSWTYFTGVIEQKSIVHVTADGGETTLCGKGGARSGNEVTVWKAYAPPTDARRCKCCANRSNHIFKHDQTRCGFQLKP